MSKEGFRYIVRFLPGALMLLVFSVCADDVYKANKAGNRLYEKGKYSEAVKKYEDALVSSPGNGRVNFNKGTAHFKAGEYEKALESYDKASGIKEKEAKADLYYNKGTALFTKAEAALRSGQPDMETYKKAKESFIQSLDMRPSDRDAKWNLELVQSRIRQLEKQQKNQENQNKNDQNNKKNKNSQKNKDQNNDQDQNNQKKQNDQQKKGDQRKDKKEKQQKKQQKEKEGEKKQEKSAGKEDKKEQDKPVPRPEKAKEDMEKKKAMRLIQQYADDAKELKKPQEKMLKPKAGGSEKDW